MYVIHLYHNTEIGLKNLLEFSMNLSTLLKLVMAYCLSAWITLVLTVHCKRLPIHACVAAAEWAAGARGTEVTTASEATRHSFRLPAADVSGS